MSTPRRIAIDARMALYQRRGMGHHTLQLIKAMARLDQETHYDLLVHKKQYQALPVDHANFFARPLTMPNYVLWEQFRYPITARRQRYDLVHFPANTAPLAPCAPLVTTIHDTNYLKKDLSISNPWSPYEQLKYAYRRSVMPRTARLAAKVITDSQSSKEDIVRMFHVPEDKVVVIYCGVGEQFRPSEDIQRIGRVKAQYGIHGPYILTFGGHFPTKNTLRVLEAYKTLGNSHASVPELVVVGPKTLHQSEIGSINASNNHRVTVTGYVPDEDLPYLYSGASCLIFASLAEGFGLPPLEAMACGTPVVATNRTAVPEVVGNAALLINPYSTQEIREGMEALLGNPSLRGDLVDRGLERSRQFTWERAAEETLKVYESVLKR